MTQLNNNKRLDKSKNIVENEPNEAMQPASETTESPAAPAKKGLLTRTRIGEKAIIAVVALLTPISAKTPPILNRIGKGIGKFWIPILLVIATALTPIQIEQVEAASASTNRITRQTPPSYRSKSPTSSTNRVIPARRNIAPPSRTAVPTYRPSTNQVSLSSRSVPLPTRTTRTNTVQTPNRARTPVPTRRTIPSRTVVPTSRTIQPAAVPPPVVVVAKPILKRGAIEAGKWLIAVLAEYGVHTALDKVFQNNKGQEANAIVHGARWLSNEYFKKMSSPNTPPPRNVLTTIATMGDEDDPASAEGWNAISNRSMTQSEAKGYLKRRIATITTSSWAAILPATPTKHAQTMFFPIKARTDHYAAEEARILALYRAMHPTIILTKGGEDLKKWKVGSFVMFSDFVDPPPILKKLGTENAIDSEANYYEATARWQYQELNPNGTWSKWYKGKKKFSQETGDGIKSWDDHTFDFDFCDDNQEITAPAIYEGIRRFISKRPVYERKRRTGQMRRGGDYTWVRVGWEPVVAQEYQDLN